jgi:uncharacterized membrane protein YdjX (TVP38/TMEM64 family)
MKDIAATGSPSDAPMEKTARFPWTRVAAGLAALAAFIVLVRLLPIGSWLKGFQVWARGLGAPGLLLYALIYAACTVLFVPGSVLTLGAGAVYGVWLGTAVVSVGANLGAFLAFLLARTLLRRKVESMTAGNAKFHALDRAISKEGGKIVFLVRLAPIFPFNFVNYAFGLTGVRTPAYALATLAGMIPGTFAYVYLGDLGARGAQAPGPFPQVSSTRLLINLVGAVVALIVTVFVARLASRAIKRAGVDG